MKTTLHIIIAFLVAATCIAQKVPLIKVGEKQLGITKLDVSIEVVGTIATTTYDMYFYNPTASILEGELLFPLGENQSISRFALAVNGDLREAVVVEKEQGRIAFEAVVRRRVDPALLEKGTGNTYRARIYPIPAKGYKRVVLAYQETLQITDGSHQVKIPFDFENRMERFSMVINLIGQQKEPSILSGRNKRNEMVKTETGYQYNVKEQNVILVDDFLLEIPIDEGHKILRNNDYLYAYTALKKKEVAREKNTNVTLYWDVSYSMKDRDMIKEITYLNSYFDKLQNAKVVVVTFSNVKMKRQKFRVRNGTCDALYDYLKEQVYDGATSFENLFNNINDNEDVLLFTDGMPTLSEFPSTIKGNVFVVNSIQKANHSKNKQLSETSAGNYINLQNLSISEAVGKTFFVPYKYLGYLSLSKNLEAYPPANTLVFNDFSFAARGVKAGKEIILNFGYGQKVTDQVAIIVPQSNINTNTIAALWASKKVDELEKESNKNRGEIVKVGMDYNLITNHTSLLVLETVQDYLAYNISPPAALLKEYNHLKNQLGKRNKSTRISSKDDRKEIGSTPASPDVVAIEEENIERAKSAPTGSQVTVNGTVTDNSGLALPGVNIIVRGTTNGTQSDFDGNYSINASTGQDLVYRYVGFDTLETTVHGSSSINISMQEGERLESVVITGYGGVTRERKSIGYAVTTLEEEHFSNAPENDVVRSLNGKVAGVQITGNSGATGSGTNFIIRGQSTINGNNQPLFIVDGVPFDNGTNSQTGFAGGNTTTSNRSIDIDPNNIQEIKVLKGLSAAVLYGSQGRNGVVLITTKNEGGGVEYGRNYSAKMAIEIAEKQEQRKKLSKEKTWSEKTWTTAYLSKLNEVTTGDLYEFYLSQRDAFIGQPAYFVDVYDFMKDKDAVLANRILSNIAEIDIDNYELLKVLAYKYEEQNDYTKAVFVYRQVLKLRSEDTQSYRDLALALQEIGETNEAYMLLDKVASGELTEGSQRRVFEGIHKIAANEIGNLLAKGKANTNNSNNNYNETKMDFRVVIDWNHNDTDIDLHVIDPNLEECYYSHAKTIIGGKVSTDMTEGFGPEEFTLPKMIPGSYYLKVNYFGDRHQKIENPTFLKLTIFKNYGSENESKELKVIRLSGDDGLQLIERVAVL